MLRAISFLLLLFMPVWMVLAAVPAAWAESVKPLTFFGRYDFNWSGIGLGEAVLGIEEEENRYRMRLTVKSLGVINLFTRHQSETEARGERLASANGSPTYIPLYYESFYKTKHKPRHIRLRFGREGAVVEELSEPPEDRNDRPEVPHALKDGSFDPLTWLLALLSGRAPAHIFDAKRLYAVNARVMGTTDVWIMGTWRATTALALSRVPVSGLTAKEVKEYREGEPLLTVYMSDGARRIPLKLRLPLVVGSITGVLVKECGQWADCAIAVDVK